MSQKILLQLFIFSCIILSSSINGQTTTTTAGGSTTIRQFTVRSNPFSNGNDAMTFESQTQQLVGRLNDVLDNTSVIELTYNSSTQSQQCWADVQECTQTFTWWFNGTAALQNQQLFLAKGYNDADAAIVLNVEIFREGTEVPAKTRPEPSIMPFLMTLCFTYGAISLGSIIIMVVGYKLANR